MRNRQRKGEHELRVTVLSENSTFSPGIGAEHGLSLSIELRGRHVLFDTGAGDLFLRNAGVIPVTLQNLKAVFISHGHYDHTGGLLRALHLFDIPAYAHPDILTKRYVIRGGKARSIGLPFTAEELKRDGIVECIHLNRNPEEIDGFTLSGEIPRRCPFEKPNPRFFKDDEGKRLDLIQDDQCLSVKTVHGLVVFLGCAHAGLINTLAHVLNISGETRFHWIIGGTHLMNASDEKLRKTGTALAEIDFDFISPLHCTGMQGQHLFQQRFGKKYRPLFCGDTLLI
jgi:7,8-dihydropterin-6-yl-methyl-4-(beta-D-ribofuranosyl)aminobenzene 5'-phosphate synthase